MAAALTVTIEEDDSRGVVVSESAVTVEEGDADGATYTVALATEPTDAVTVTVSGTVDTDVRVEPASLTFGTSDWERGTDGDGDGGGGR